MALAATFAFTSCSNDDDGGGACATCTTNALGTEITTKACDNGDGTVNVTIAGISQTLTEEDLEGTTAAEYVQALKDGCPSN